MVFRLSSNPRHSRRSGNPDAPPSFSPPRESRALRIRQHRHGGADAAGGRRPGQHFVPQPRRTTTRALDPRCGEDDGGWALDYYEKAIFILMGGFNQAIRHSRRRGNPEPFLPFNLIGSAGMVRVERWPVHQARHNCHNRLGAWPGLWIPAATGMTN